MKNYEELIGKKINMLTIIKINKNTNKQGRRTCVCLCDCGKIREDIEIQVLIRKNPQKSCGCIRANSRKSHGMSRTSLHRVWTNLKARCKNENQPQYKDYGGRGIKYFKEWEQFEPFMDWAFKNGYEEGLTLDRIDNNGNYEPSNCRWVTQKKQANNTRKTIFLTHEEVTLSTKEWESLVNISSRMLRKRKKDGWKDVQILYTSKHYKSWWGELKPVHAFKSSEELEIEQISKKYCEDYNRADYEAFIEQCSLS